MGAIKGTFGVEKIFYRPLVTAGSTAYQELPTIEAGDFQVSTDGSAWTNLDTLPTEVPGGTEQVKITVSADEMEGDQISIRAIDAADDEWEPDWWVIETEANELLIDLLGSIANVGAAVNTPAESYALTTGTQSANTYTETSPLDGVYHEHTDDGGALDLYYQFDVGGDGVPSRIQVTGRITGNNDDLDGVYAYNWGGSTWDRIGSFDGQNTSVDPVRGFDLFTSHVGTGANLGKVRIRFWAAAGLTSATLLIDQIFCAYSVVRRSVGYADGSIWVDTNASNTNTENYVDGTADNPVSTWAAALSLSSQLNIKRFHIANGSTITLSGNSDNYTLHGSAWTLALNGQSISGISIDCATISGIGTNGANLPTFKNCHLGSVTLPVSHIDNSGMIGPVILGEAGTYYFDRCHSSVAGVSVPIIDFGAAIGSTSLNMRGYSGGVEIENMGGAGTDRMSLEGHGQFVANANCAAGVVAIRGHFTKSGAGLANLTLSDDARFDVDQITAALSVVGGGAFAVDITTQESDTTPISDVAVSIFTDSARTNLFATVNTGLTGTYTGLGMNAGTYYWAAAKVGITFSSGSFTISESGEEVLVGTVETPSLPDSPNLCVISGTLRNAGGVVLVGADINAYAITPQIVSGVQMDNRIASATSSVTGYFELPLERGTEVRLVIELANRDETLTVPDAAGQDIATWTA